MSDFDAFSRWSFFPGSPVRVGLLVPPHGESLIKALLPDHWDVGSLWEWKALAGRLDEFQVLLTTVPVEDLPEVEERLGAVAILPDPPPVALYGRTDSESLPVVQAVKKALPVVELAGSHSDRRRLPRIVNEVRGRSMLKHLVAEILPVREFSPLLIAGLEKCLLQRPFPEGKALRILDDGGRTFIRKAGHLADAMSCSLSFLETESRRLGIRLDYTTRFIALLHVLVLYEPRISPFCSVAPRIGIREGSALTRFFRRITGLCPTEAVREDTIGGWGQELIRLVSKT